MLARMLCPTKCHERSSDEVEDGVGHHLGGWEAEGEHVDVGGSDEDKTDPKGVRGEGGCVHMHLS